MLSLCYNFAAGPKHVVSVDSGLGKEKGLEILSLFVSMKKEDLPVEAHSIIKECKGTAAGVCVRGGCANPDALFIKQAGEYANLANEHLNVFYGI